MKGGREGAEKHKLYKVSTLEHEENNSNQKKKGTEIEK